MSQYLSFVLFAAVVAIAPGPDTFLTLRNTVMGGRGRGLWTTFGICSAGATQGVLAALGLGAIIARAEPVFQAIRWAGVAYLTYLGFLALRAAVRGHGMNWEATGLAPRSPWRSFRQGFLCNITNPKVLAFNLAVLPQFAGADTGMAGLLAYALTLTLVGLVVLLAVVAGASRARTVLQGRRAQRTIEGGTGVVMLGFAAVLAGDD
ncbi:LysE family translocator [Calidifontibacter sp. DB0510]|uniref:LysE family translocator n=1 Tax=Metallococcus carri TaxID=1656884 RepID=A0A967E912_9MICO|nr:LysE family translocator [Metallococcus carri]NHN54735.1 LysE family translocator [Metallococcus carri]NOP37080.1 LysE family translocator [Calidifontibacter sp. DB2511S]